MQKAHEASAERVLAVGEVLWDLIGGREHIGGAPFNVAAHLARLGNGSSILTRIGRDARGLAALREMERLGVDASFVQTDDTRPTGWAEVSLTGDGVPTFRFPDDPAYDFIACDAASEFRGPRFDAVCFGTLAQRGAVTRASLHRLLAELPAREVFFDVNIRRGFLPEDVLRASLSRATIVKLNADEVPVVAERLGVVATPEREFAARLTGGFPVRVVCVTKGGEGCTVHAAGEARDLPGVKVTVADTVGSGDAFSAAFLHHYLRTGDPFESARRGNLLGAYVASKPGAVPDYDAAILRQVAG